MFTWKGDLPLNTPAGIELVGEEISGVFERGFECYGIPIGTDNYVKYKLKCRADQIVKDADQTTDLLSLGKLCGQP